MSGARSDRPAGRQARRARRGRDARARRRCYDKLGRHRDLITNQIKLAEITPDVEEKKELYRAAAALAGAVLQRAERDRCLRRCSRVAPDDREARERLEELYRKRRAWAPLYELYAADLTKAEGGKQLPLLREMAALAAERLNRSADAIALYQKILEIDPTRAEVLDALGEAQRA